MGIFISSSTFPSLETPCPCYLPIVRLSGNRSGCCRAAQKNCSFLNQQADPQTYLNLRFDLRNYDVAGG